MVGLHLRRVGLAAGMVGLQSRSGSGNINGGSAPLKSGSDNQSAVVAQHLEEWVWQLEWCVCNLEVGPATRMMGLHP